MLFHQEKVEEENILAEIKVQYQKLLILLEKKGYARKRRENSATNEGMINSCSSSTRYRRRRKLNMPLNTYMVEKKVQFMEHGII